MRSLHQARHETLDGAFQASGAAWPSVEGAAAPRRDESVRADGAVAAFTDVTARAERAEMEEALRASEERYRSLVEHSPDGVHGYDMDSRLIFVNEACCRISGYTHAELLALGSLLPLVDQDDRAVAAAHFQAALRGEVSSFECTVRRKDEQRRLVQVTDVPLLLDGVVHGVYGLTKDVTDQRRAEAALRESEELFRALSEQASDLVSILDADGTIRYASPTHERILGYGRGELEGTHAFRLAHPDDLALARRRFGEVMAGPRQDDPVRAEIRYRHADGSWVTLEMAAVDRRHDPVVRGVIVTSRDVTERVRMEEALRHQALHDDLTDLPNRSLLQDRLGRALGDPATGRDSAPLALLLLDLDRFKEINDAFGHCAGDLLLQEIARRLRAVTGAADTVARLGGDEFAVLLPGAGRDEAVRAAERIAAALERPFLLDGQPLQVGASVGAALAPMHGADGATLLRRADVAMYVAKRRSAGYAEYAPQHDTYTPDRLALVADLRRAIAEDGLTLYYQPQAILSSGEVASVEALVRWRHPIRGLILPDHFIALAEQTGLIGPLTEWVLRAAVRQLQTWRRAGLDLGIAVNLSMANLRDAGLPESLAELLRAHEVPASRLRIEVTESTLMADTAQAQEVLGRLAALEVGVSVDDYGTGYSSLAYLKRLPVDELKIDMSFVRHMMEDEADRAIVASTVGLGHSLGLRVVAEGVEGREGWATLREMGCDTAQGYYLSRPLPAAELERWLRGNQGANRIVEGEQAPCPGRSRPIS